MKVKKFMAVFLTFVMLAGMLPATAYAGECPAEDSSRNGVGTIISAERAHIALPPTACLVPTSPIFPRYG